MIINSCSVQLQMSMVKRASRGIKAIPQMTPPCGLRAISGQSGAILGQKGKWQERQWTGYWSINGRSICIGSVSRRGDCDEDEEKNWNCDDLCILLVREEQSVPKSTQNSGAPFSGQANINSCSQWFGRYIHANMFIAASKSWYCKWSEPPTPEFRLNGTFFGSPKNYCLGNVGIWKRLMRNDDGTLQWWKCWR